jgi:hypothetical protein
MATRKNQSDLLGILAGEGGDYYIGNQAAVADKLFTHIIFGPDGGTLVGVQIGSQDVKTARNYPASIPGGYIMCAGTGKSFNYINLSAGNASGLVDDTSEFETL